MASTDPVLPDSLQADAGKNIDAATEAELNFTDWETRTDELIAATDVWLKEVKEVSTEEHANRADSFVTQLRNHWKLVEAGRVAEKRPHDAAADEVQEKYKPQLGRLGIAGTLMKDMKKPWLRKLEREQEERERQARLAAQEEQRKANEAARKAAEAEHVADVAAAAEAQKKADEASVQADRVSRETVGVRGDYSKKKSGIRRAWAARIVDIGPALTHYRRRAEVQELLTSLASADARAAKGDIDIPGFEVYQKETG